MVGHAVQELLCLVGGEGLGIPHVGKNELRHNHVHTLRVLQEERYETSILADGFRPEGRCANHFASGQEEARCESLREIECVPLDVRDRLHNELSLVERVVNGRRQQDSNGGFFLVKSGRFDKIPRDL